MARVPRKGRKPLLAAKLAKALANTFVYSAAAFDLDAGPAASTLPDPGKRFLSMQLSTKPRRWLIDIFPRSSMAKCAESE
ncbi:MAG TPA: hypothetical protein VGG79_00625 [Roseiarcus sp.]